MCVASSHGQHPARWIRPKADPAWPSRGDIVGTTGRELAPGTAPGTPSAWNAGRMWERGLVAEHPERPGRGARSKRSSASHHCRDERLV